MRIKEVAHYFVAACDCPPPPLLGFQVPYLKKTHREETEVLLVISRGRRAS